MDADSAIVEAATWTAALAAGWLVVRAGVSVLRERPGAARGMVGLGLAVAVATGGVALAAPGDGSSPPSPGVSVDWPARSHPGQAGSVTVRPGDCLWGIAARHLRRPTAAHVAVAWPRWWQANQRLVGPNPNLIRPGLRLRPPVTVRSRS